MPENGSTLCLRPDLEALRAIGPWLRSKMAAEAPSGLAERSGEIELAVHELAVNIAEHALGFDGEDFTIEFSADGTTVQFRFRDRGIEVLDEHVQMAGPETPQVRGYGMMIVEQLAADIDYRRIDDRNEWVVTFA